MHLLHLVLSLAILVIMGALNVCAISAWYQSCIGKHA